MIDSADNVTHMLPVTGPLRLNFFTDQPDLGFRARAAFLQSR